MELNQEQLKNAQTEVFKFIEFNQLYHSFKNKNEGISELDAIDFANKKADAVNEALEIIALKNKEQSIMLRGIIFKSTLKPEADKFLTEELLNNKEFLADNIGDYTIYNKLSEENRNNFVLTNTMLDMLNSDLGNYSKDKKILKEEAEKFFKYIPQELKLSATFNSYILSHENLLDYVPEETFKSPKAIQRGFYCAITENNSKLFEELVKRSIPEIREAVEDTFIKSYAIFPKDLRAKEKNINNAINISSENIYSIPSEAEMNDKTQLKVLGQIKNVLLPRIKEKAQAPEGYEVAEKEINALGNLPFFKGVSPHIELEEQFKQIEEITNNEFNRLKANSANQNNTTSTPSKVKPR